VVAAWLLLALKLGRMQEKRARGVSPEARKSP